MPAKIFWNKYQEPLPLDIKPVCNCIKDPFFRQIEGPVDLVGVVRKTETRQQFEPKNQGKAAPVWAYRLINWHLILTLSPRNSLLWKEFLLNENENVSGFNNTEIYPSCVVYTFASKTDILLNLYYHFYLIALIFFQHFCLL